MSMLDSGDASEFEGAFKRKEITTVSSSSRHKKGTGDKPAPEEKEPTQVAAAKSGWGTETSPVPKKIEEPSAVNDYNWDDEDEAEAEANAVKTSVAASSAVDETLIATVAEAPKVLPTMQSIKELDRQVKFSVPSVTEGVDLTLLAAVLHPYDQLVERDEPWEFDKLFVKISSELQLELEKKDRENDEKEKERDEDVQNPGTM